MSKIEPKPKAPPARTPNEWRYWDAQDLEGELKRSFEVCHGCRMCVNYCGSFPDMFARVDRDIDRGATGAERLLADDFKGVTELCWQCKLCYIDCPYTPDQGHEWQLDIPRLLQREKANRARRNGITIQDRALGEPGKLGALSSGPMASVTNLVNANRLARKVNEKVLGISAEFPLPPFATQPFAKWFDKHSPMSGAGERGEVALFATCVGDYNFPQIAKAAVLVLERNGFRVTRPNLECCGMPNLDGGDIEEAKRKAQANVSMLAREIDAGRSVVVLQPTCSYMVKKEYPELLDSPEAARVAKSTFDAMEFMERLRREKQLDLEFTNSLGKVAYHAACHLRAQKIGTPGARVLGLVKDTEVEVIAKCSAVDGTWGMKTQHYEMGKKYAQKLVRGIEDIKEENEAALVVTDCPLSGQRILGETGEAPMHPIEALARAYGI